MAIVCPQRYNSSFAPHQTTHHVGIMHSSSKRYSQPTAGPSTPFIRGTTEGHIGPLLSRRLPLRVTGLNEERIHEPEEAYKPFSASDDTEEERNEVRGRGGLVLLERGEQEHLYVVFLPDVGLPGSENTAMIISIIASFFSFFQNLGANAIATGASPVTSIFESFSGSIT
ncbi:hypothetical protein V6N11_019765 [Hibiscus sabdariffa]|uniref:Uncharacterized protein n=1 Tax=Hibiscus sabdariffa TaxID=183260 RepID=A0ABR2A512_9ROSI